ncbi:MAG: lactoylglutathione lyase [Porticoccaceae bacterium]|nr:lactoylglutathione lyase [Porticoccaceae bacterium]
MKKERPFNILGVQQIAIGAPDKNLLLDFWTGLLGIKKVGNYESAAENVNEDICQIGHGAFAVELDLMEPLDSELRPRVDTPPLNHIGLWVDDLQTAYESLINQGVRMAPGGIRKGASGHDVCFIHPKGNDEFPNSALGVLVELVQAPDSVIDAHSSLSKG